MNKMDAVQQFALEYFVAIKTIHILSATLWAFATAAPMVCYVLQARALLSADPTNEELQRRSDWVLEQFDRVVVLEHGSFLILLLTGILLYSTGIADLTQRWFALKTAIVLGFFIPLEVYDIWLSHVKAPRMTRNKEADPLRYAAFRDSYYKYLKALGLPILLTVPTVLVLALAKPL